MPSVYNWQLGREMEYPYEGMRPRRQFAMILDTNKCIACQTCTVACKTTWTAGRGQEYMLWNNVETKPYGYYPLGWDVNILDRQGVQTMDGPVYHGKTLFEAAPEGEVVLGYRPKDEDYAYPNVGEDDCTGEMGQGAWLSMPHMQWMYYLPRICNHCTYPACLSACPRKVIYKREEDGIVLLDQNRCRGYRECVTGCPYKKVFFNPMTRVSEKCIGCYPAIENDRQTQCTITCIGKIRLQGFITTPDQAREDNPMDYIIHVAKVARPLYPQFGLEPNTYYIPPVHVPPEYLRQMFGWGVEEAIDTYRRAHEDPKLLAAMLLFGATAEIIHHFRIEGGTVIGFNDKGAEVVRVPMKEPTYIREAYDARFDTWRTNVT
ncbi:4Fe-4S dicluster domain-containing protein [Thioalkalivibrio thiocyanodenitrificans]|uniref:4Fe-4S dicluster domain-containing protein n=1 Tax=Thioalkalivibrio thiocyanodenitrificans TaxID=243063 RepID=UPI000380A6BA|nr:4Fe-4S dicluster domain-containing protein [Thioalkalivibrio thiocyanodenitrificans]